MAWVYTIPAWLFTVLVITVMCGLSVGGLMLVRRYVPRKDELTHNDVAGPIVGTLGTILAVMLSFMVVTIWQEYDQAALSVDHEASAIADLYHLCANLPDPTRSRLRKDLQAYTDTVVRDEWPLMRRGEYSQRARHQAIDALSIVTSMTPRTPAQATAQNTAISLAERLMDARRERLFENDQTIPPLLWTVMIFTGAVTIASSYLFYVRSFRSQIAMTVALTLVIGAVFVLVAELDLPFRGDLQITPHAFVHAYRAFVN